MPCELQHLPEEESLNSAALEALQRRKLAALLAEIRQTDPFYREKFRDIQFNAPADRLELNAQADAFHCLWRSNIHIRF